MCLDNLNCKLQQCRVYLECKLEKHKYGLMHFQFIMQENGRNTIFRGKQTRNKEPLMIFNIKERTES